MIKQTETRMIKFKTFFQQHTKGEGELHPLTYAYKKKKKKLPDRSTSLTPSFETYLEHIFYHMIINFNK